LEERGYRVGKRAVYQGLARVRWPGRMELVQDAPQILLDGAHNPAAAESLRASLQEEFDYRCLYMVMGVMADKEVAAILAAVAPLADVLIATTPPNPRAMSAQRIAEIAQLYCREVKVIEDVREGVDYARKAATGDDLIVITGSLFTVGAVRDHLLSTEQV
jgi:dihydrofolate synthase/folylpolyglutamate synthase